MMLGTPHGEDPSIGSTIRHDRVGPTYPLGEADRPDFAVITTVVPVASASASAKASKSSVALSTCGDTRSTGACSSNGARCTSAYVMTIRRSAISHDHLLRVGAVELGQRRDGRRPSDRLDDSPAGHIGQRGPGRLAQLRQPRAGPIRAGCQMFAERDRIPHGRSDIGVAVLQPLQHGQRQIPVRRRQPRSQPLRQIARTPTPRGRARCRPTATAGWSSTRRPLCCPPTRRPWCTSRRSPARWNTRSRTSSTVVQAASSLAVLGWPR